LRWLQGQGAGHQCGQRGAFGAAGPVGSGVGLIAGGLILSAYSVTQPVLPFLGAIEPWQATFIAVGLPGIIIAVFMLFVPEPRVARKGSAHATAEAVNVPLAQVKDYIVHNRRTITAFLVGAGFYYMSVYGYAGWGPTYFVRHFGWKYAEIGKVFGLLLILGGPVGALFATWLGDYWMKRGVSHGYLRVALIAVVGITVSTCAMVTVPTANLAVVFLGLSAFFSFFMFSVGPAVIAQITPAPMRGQIAALYTGVLNLLGAGLGPVAVGVLTDYVLRDSKAIAVSMFIVFAVAGTVAALLIRSGLKSYAGTLKRAAEWQLKPEAAQGVSPMPAVGVTAS
jgi:MFS family permease